MGIRYIPAPDLEKRVKDIVNTLNLTHIDCERVKCVRSMGSSSKNIYARIHGVSRAFLTGLRMKPHYVIEFISENFDSLPEEEKDRIIIHELLHIPKTFSGGLLSHRAARMNREVAVLFEILHRSRGRA